MDSHIYILYKLNARQLRKENIRLIYNNARSIIKANPWVLNDFQNVYKTKKRHIIATIICISYNLCITYYNDKKLFLEALFTSHDNTNIFQTSGSLQDRSYKTEVADGGGGGAAVPSGRTRAKTNIVYEKVS